MKKFFLFSALAVFGLFACKQQSKVLQTVESSKLTGQMKVKLGETVKINLRSNASTGYAWDLGHKLDKNVLEFTERVFVEDENPGMMVGVGGIETWSFKGLKKGKAFVHMVYARGDQDPKEEKIYEVTVE